MDSPTPRSSQSADDDYLIPMTNMEEIVMPPKYPTNTSVYHDNVDFEDGLDSEDLGGQALLGSEGRTRSRERYLAHGQDKWYQIKAIALETAPSLLFATFGAMFTGELMDKVPNWIAMRRIDELIIIIPVILNLKGNLEMNLSARLGTAANMGQLDNYKTRRSIIVGNLSLLQVQATVVSFIATCVAFFLGSVIPDPALPVSSGVVGRFIARSFYSGVTSPTHHVYARKPIRPHPSPNKAASPPGLAGFVMVAATSMTATCLSSIILGSFMCALVVVCRKYGRDPDNIAPPVASCLGDLITLCLLGVVSSIYIDLLQVPVVLIIISLALFAAGAGWTYVTLQNPHTKPLLQHGWSPLLGAMVISSGTGIVLDIFVNRYTDFGLLAVAISSLPGGVGSIFVSRLSTALHATASSLSSISIQKWTDDKPQPSSRLVMIILSTVTFPIAIAFLAILHGVGWLKVPILFIVFFVVFFCVAIVASLFIARGLANLLWSKDLDPDIYALPIHSALMDLIGQLLLVGCFELVAALGGRVRS